MSELIFPKEFQSDQMLHLASSIVTRSTAEQTWANTILAETFPAPLEQPNEITKSIQVGATVAMLKRLESPDEPIDVLSYAQSLVDNKTIADSFRSLGQSPEDTELSAARTMIDQQVKIVLDHFNSNNEIEDVLIHTINSATVVAEKHSVGLATVFESDELYAEYTRTRYTPETYINGVSSRIDKLNIGLFTAITENYVIKLLQYELAEGIITQEELETEKAEILIVLQEDPEFISEIESITTILRDAMPRIAERSVERFWGSQEAMKVPAYLGRIVAQSDIILTDTVREIQSEKDLFITLCMERGWDPSNLTIEQTASINTNDAMRNLRTDLSDNN